MKKTEITNRYTALGSDGKKYAVIEYTEFIGATTIHDSRVEWVPGMKTLKLESGEHVNKVSEGQYQALRSKVTLAFKGP